MKTKEQILRWLDKQPWKCEFYEAAVLSDRACKISYNENLMNRFDWASTKQGSHVWMKRNVEYLEWYNSPNNRPQSWEEYCKKNPVQETDWFIDDSCQVLPIEGNCIRDYDTSANIMSKEYCEAFVAYMKLFQLRNAWVQDFDGVLTYRLIIIDDKLYIRSMDYDTNGLSFPTGKMAEVFMEIFKDLLEVAKPLL